MSVIEKGSTVLVTGINGFIGSHTADQLLQAGYNVRGTVRTEAKGAWVKELLEKKYGTGKVDIVTIPDMAATGAFDGAVKGCSGVVHVASDLSFSSNPNDVIPSVIAGMNHTLAAADAEPKVKRFVYTSSSTAATNPKPNEEFSIDEKTWNNECVDRAWAPPPYKGREWDVYAASKTLAEQALWKFVDERKPHFQVNTVLPNANFGAILSPENQGAPSTAGWPVTLYKDGLEKLESYPPQWFINVQDTARLHVAALLDPSIKHERIFGFAEPYNWNTILRILRKLRPDHKLPADVTNESRDLSKVIPRSRAEEILKQNFGQSGFISLEESLKDNIAHLK